MPGNAYLAAEPPVVHHYLVGFELLVKFWFWGDIQTQCTYFITVTRKIAFAIQDLTNGLPALAVLNDYGVLLIPLVGNYAMCSETVKGQPLAGSCFHVLFDGSLSSDH